MPSTTELLKTELGQAFVEARDKSERIKMPYTKNEIGEDIIRAWNPIKQKSPYAVVIAKEFDKMIKEVIPQDAILSARFQSWINREKNELMVDSKIAKDAYFKSQTNFETGEVNENRKNDILQAKMNYLTNELARLSKAFKTHMEKNPEVAFANEETLAKFKTYYTEQAQKVSERLEKGDFSAYDKKDKDGNVIKAGNEEDAQKHKTNIDALLSDVENAQQVQNAKAEQAGAEQQDYVGDTFTKALRNKI